MVVREWRRKERSELVADIRAACVFLVSGGTCLGSQNSLNLGSFQIRASKWTDALLTCKFLQF